MIEAPDAVLRTAAGAIGPVQRIERLDGLSGATVLRMQGSHGSLVAKGGAHPRECAFYEHVRLTGVAVPSLLDVVDDVESWLLLEDVPEELPETRWGDDPQVVATLRRLHAHRHSVLDALPSLFTPTWPPELTTAAAADLELPARTVRLLDVVRRHAQPLFEPLVVISGDANPRNWRVRADDVVLLDWERAGLGHPALDLAIALPGLPTMREAQAMVEAYDFHDVTVEQLLGAKTWSVVEFAAGAGGHDGLAAVLDGVAGALEHWLETWH